MYVNKKFIEMKIKKWYQNTKFYTNKKPRRTMCIGVSCQISLRASVLLS